MTRNIYIDNTDLETALLMVETSFSLAPTSEIISVKDSLGRVIFNSIFAKTSSPSYSASAMDGIYLFAKKTHSASETTPIYLTHGEDFIYVNTGEPLNYKNGDSVVMIEDVIPLEENKIKLYKSSAPWDNIRIIGEDIIQGQLILRENHTIVPQDFSALISAGIKEIEVLKKPSIAILPTGNEVVDIFKEKNLSTEGKVIDSNSYMFSAMIQEWGGNPLILDRSSDDKEILKSKILSAIDKSDILIINAGSSAGSKDFTRVAIEELGEVLLHGVAIKPGKPIVVGKIRDKLVLGIPGYPVSAYLSLEIFLKPLMEKITKTKKSSQYVEATLSKDIFSSLKYKEFIRVTLSYIEGTLVATPLTRGAGITMSLVKADGILEIPKNSEGISKGTKISVRLLKPLSEIENYLVSIGSHDIVMEHIADKIKLVSTHTGSFGGVLAIKNKTTHIAPIHILDEKTGTYNIEVLKKYFPDGDIALIKGVKRVQGIMVEKGNPHNIKNISDLTKPEVLFANRQRGAGTRILLDYCLNMDNIQGKNILGYEKEFTTHLEVAMAIKSKLANVGLGIKEAATIADLDFIPIKDEEYDFLVEKKNLNTSNIIEFISFLKSEYFERVISKIDGYSLSNPGKIILT